MYWAAFPFRFEVLDDPKKEFERQIASLMERKNVNRENAIKAVRRQSPDLNREYQIATNPPEMRQQIEAKFAPFGTWQPGQYDGEYYVPSTADLEAIRRVYPDMDPMRPDWHRIFVDLVESGRDPGFLEKLRAPDILRLLETERANQGDPPEEPKAYLTSWREILDALDLTKDDRGKVSKLNKDFSGPIIIAGQGTQPKVSKDTLLAWWQGLEKRFVEIQQRERDRVETVSVQHEYGREGKVFSEIDGGEKKRRKDIQR